MKNYNPEIDSLRAIAVISVILYHTQIVIFDNLLSKSGFIGVDIFIVISGFVITKLFFYKDFSYFKFLERRSRRLLPAFLVLIFATTIFSYFFLLPQHFVNLGQSIIANVFLISNFLFFYQTNYWEFSVLTKPLLHTWTLSLEVQFYIFICIIFLLFKKNIIKTIIIFFFISMILLFFSEKINLNYNLRELSLNNYFLLFTRLWEFLTGSLVAIILNNKKYTKNFKVQNYFNNVGLIIILLSFLLIQTPKDYPNFLTVLPVLGTALILLTNNKHSSHIILNHSFLIHLGKMSYSLYLWHFPVLIFILYNSNFELNILEKTFSLLLIYFLSLGSYKFVEIPFFKKNILTRKKFFALSTLLMLATLLLGILIVNKTLNPKLASKYGQTINNFPHYNFLQAPKRNSLINRFTDSKKIKILICGDSHGYDLALALQSNQSLNQRYEIEFEMFMGCVDKNSLPVEKLKKTDYVLSSIQLGGKGYNTYDDIKKLNKIVTLDYSKKFVMVGATTEFQTDTDLLLNYLMINNLKKNDVIKNTNNINQFFYKNKKKNIENVNKNLIQIASDLNVTFLDKSHYICKESKKICYGVDSKANKNFFDYSHYTNHGAIFFGNIIANTNWLKLN